MLDGAVKEMFWSDQGFAFASVLGVGRLKNHLGVVAAYFRDDWETGGLCDSILLWG
jgi:hypothetical protein